MQKIDKNIIRLTSALLVFIIFLSLFCGGRAVSFAATSVNTGYEQTNVLDDLEGSLIGGKTFDIADYPYNDNGRPAVLMFAEYGFSFYSDKQDDYGLYVYVYNPQARTKLLADSENNKIEFRYGNDTNYHKFGLALCNYSAESSNAGLFYKFKVILTDSEKTAVLSTLSVDREYQLSGIELTQKDSGGSVNLEDFPVASTYTYSGYAAGYGINGSAESTLTCTVVGFEEYLGLEVGYTSYVVDGDTQTRDMLMSVYFSVPYDYVESYGELYAVKATWLKAMSSWGAVIGYEDAYNAISSYVNKTLTASGYPSYMLVTDFTEINSGDWHCWSCSNIYNEFVANDYANSSWNANGAYMGATDEVIDRLDYLYDSSFSVADSADNYEVSAEKILQTIRAYTAAHPNETKVGDKYASSMFSEVAESYTTQEYTTDEKDDFSLEKVTLSQSFWDKLFGKTVETSSSYDGIKAIQRIYSTDFSSNADDIDNVCKNLYIGKTDYWTIKSYVDDKTADTDRNGKPDNAVYLFRFDVADYYSAEASIAYYSENTGFFWKDEIVTASTNAYIFKTPVYINFDIIQLTFRNADGVKTVVPVVMSPIDIAGAVLPPAQTTSDSDGFDWRIIMGVVAVVLLIVLCAPFLPIVLKAVVWVVSLPFKALGALFKAIFHKKE